MYAPRHLFHVPHFRRRVPALLALAFGFMALGCQAKIGDACRRSTDCSLRGERICDLSNRVAGQGECTIEGCGRDECPDEAACVKTYGNDFLSISCDPMREDRAAIGPDGVALPPRNDCDPNEVCLPEGLCADEITARTSCRRKCKNNGQCRSGYECRWTGARGIYRAPDPDDPTNDRQVKICMPVGV